MRELKNFFRLVVNGGSNDKPREKIKSKSKSETVLSQKSKSNNQNNYDDEDGMRSQSGNNSDSSPNSPKQSRQQEQDHVLNRKSKSHQHVLSSSHHNNPSNNSQSSVQNSANSQHQHHPNKKHQPHSPERRMTFTRSNNHVPTTAEIASNSAIASNAMQDIAQILSPASPLLLTDGSRSRRGSSTISAMLQLSQANSSVLHSTAATCDDVSVQLSQQNITNSNETTTVIKEPEPFSPERRLTTMLAVSQLSAQVTDLIASDDLQAAHAALYQAVKSVKGIHALDRNLSTVYSRLIIQLSNKEVDEALRGLVLTTLHSKSDDIVAENVKNNDEENQVAITPAASVSIGNSLAAEELLESSANVNTTDMLSDDDEDDPLERYVPAAHKCITWKLFERIMEDNIRLDPEAYLVLAERLDANDEAERALKVLESMGKELWDFDIYKFAIHVCLHTRPQNIEYVRGLIKEFGERNPATDEQVNLLWMFFHSQAKEAKWTECVLRYEETRSKTTNTRSKMELDNAMMELCLTYDAYEYGWGIYEKMTEMSKHSCVVAMRLCRLAFYSLMNNSSLTESGKTGMILEDDDKSALPISPVQIRIEPIDDSQQLSTSHNDIMLDNPSSPKSLTSVRSSISAISNTPVLPDDQFKWEARAWAVYMKFKMTPDMQQSATTHIILHELLEIVSESPEISSRFEKANRIVEEFKVLSQDALLYDEWIVRPILRLCLKLHKNEIETCDAAKPISTVYIDKAFNMYKELVNRALYKCHPETYVILLELASSIGDGEKFDTVKSDFFSSGAIITRKARETIESVHQKLINTEDNNMLTTNSALLKTLLRSRPSLTSILMMQDSVDFSRTKSFASLSASTTFMSSSSPQQQQGISSPLNKSLPKSPSSPLVKRSPSTLSKSSSAASVDISALATEVDIDTANPKSFEDRAKLLLKGVISSSLRELRSVIENKSPPID